MILRLSGWDWAALWLVMIAVVLLAGAVRELADGFHGSGIAMVAAALGALGAWRGVRWLEHR
jgi:hypothetical protein